MSSPASVGCFSYLARVHTINVDRHPELNYGTAIQSQDHFLAGDGPIVAGALTALGHRAVLAANHPADDEAGRALLRRLMAWNVDLLTGPPPRQNTRTNIVACDRAGNRTWYADLDGVDQELAHVNLAALLDHDVIYLDAYDVLAGSAAAVARAAAAARRYTVINLGGSAAPDWLADLPHAVEVLQTNGPERDPQEVKAIAHHLNRLQAAELVVVTAGSAGAYALDADGSAWTAKAIDVTVRQPQGAGAMFSAALIHGSRSGLDVAQRLQFACSAGSLWCTRGTEQPMPSLRDIEQIVTP